MSGAPSGGHAYGIYTDPEFPGVRWRRPGFEPQGKRWKPVKIYGTKTRRPMTDEEWRRAGTDNRGQTELFEEDPKGDDFIVRQRLVDIEKPATPAASSTPTDAAAPATPETPATPATPEIPAATLLSRRTTPQDTPQFGTESRLISAQRERERRSQTRRTRRPLLSQTPTLGPSGTLGV